jgi:DNA-binding MarR family transcriptional regulator/GNAT superfamily N-acetyltransferase
MEPASVEAVRHFNRFYTKTIGTLNRGLAKSPYSLVEARVLYEIAHRTRPTANGIAADLDLDPGYLSRTLRTFAERKLIARKTAESDRRRTFLSLTAAGRKAISKLETGTNEEIGSLLQDLSIAKQNRLTRAMTEIESLLGQNTESVQAGYELRQHRAGDLGWIVGEHGRLYAKEYGWDQTFEALVARIAADFIDGYDASRERCWIAERDGHRLGSVMLVKHPEMPNEVAKLRLLFVTEEARGLGIGRTLVGECTGFARSVGYKRITLWTNSVLSAARRLYEAEGYILTNEAPHHSFGKDLVGQTWELSLL